MVGGEIYCMNRNVDNVDVQMEFVAQFGNLYELSTTVFIFPTALLFYSSSYSLLIE